MDFSHFFKACIHQTFSVGFTWYFPFNILTLNMIPFEIQSSIQMYDGSKVWLVARLLCVLLVVMKGWRYFVLLCGCGRQVPRVRLRERPSVSFILQATYRDFSAGGASLAVSKNTKKWHLPYSTSTYSEQSKAGLVMTFSSIIQCQVL